MSGRPSALEFERRRPGDAYWMRRALSLARRHAGETLPNPTVGACVVRAGRLLAEGVHRGPGTPHAEAAALAELERGAAAGATLYVTLEPCHHHGRTPPCSRAIAEAGIERVCYAVADTNLTVRGGGGAWLEERGVSVALGLLQEEAWELNHPFFETVGGASPHVTLKLALSADGRLARRRGRVEDTAERRITGPAAHRRVHRMRAAAAAILVGRATVASDHPRLNARLPARASSHSPRPIVLDSRLRLTPSLYPARSIVFSTPEADARALVRERRDLTVLHAPTSDGTLAWRSILAQLHELGLGSLLVEGGAEVARTLLAEAPPQRLHLFLSPRILGGDGARFNGDESVGERYTTYRARRIGADLEWILRRRDLPPPPFAHRQ